jgi:hypothetical protein
MIITPQIQTEEEPKDFKLVALLRHRFGAISSYKGKVATYTSNKPCRPAAQHSGFESLSMRRCCYALSSISGTRSLMVGVGFYEFKQPWPLVSQPSHMAWLERAIKTLPCYLREDWDLFHTLHHHPHHPHHHLCYRHPSQVEPDPI